MGSRQTEKWACPSWRRSSSTSLRTRGKQELLLLLHKKTLLGVQSRWTGGHGPELRPFFSAWIPVIILVQEHESLLQTYAIIQMRKPVNDENNEDGLQEERWKKEAFYMLSDY